MKKLVCLILLAAMVLMLGGCAGKDDWESMVEAADKLADVVEDAQLRASTEQMLDGILADDFEGTYALISNFGTREDYQQVYPKFRELLNGVEEYTLKASYKSANVKNGFSTVSVRYLLTSGGKRILVEAVRAEGYEGLAGFHAYEYTPVTQNGTLDSMKGANAAQWIFLAVGMLELAAVAWAFVDCCCHRMKRKWLWLVVIALGMAAVSFTLGSGIHLRYNIGLFFNLYTALIQYSTGEFTLRLMVPVGALIYVIKRKSLLSDWGDSQPEPEAAIPEEGSQADR